MIALATLTAPGALWNVNCGGCCVWPLKNKVCLWKVPQRRGISNGVTAAPCRSACGHFLFLSPMHTHIQTISIEDCNTATTASPTHSLQRGPSKRTTNTKAFNWTDKRWIPTKDKFKKEGIYNNNSVFNTVKVNWRIADAGPSRCTVKQMCWLWAVVTWNCFPEKRDRRLSWELQHLPVDSHYDIIMTVLVTSSHSSELRDKEGKANGHKNRTNKEERGVGGGGGGDGGGLLGSGLRVQGDRAKTKVSRYPTCMSKVRRWVVGPMTRS